MTRLSTAALILAAAASACSPTAGMVEPGALPDYSRLSCQAARSQLATASSDIARLSKTQNTAAALDTIGVILLPVPIGRVAGMNHEGELAAAKASLISAETRIAECAE